jgi:hypothetical protein
MRCVKRNERFLSTIAAAVMAAASLIAGCGSGDLYCEGDGGCWCDNGEWISEDWICDGDNDCGDFQDEEGCPPQSDDDDGYTSSYTPEPRELQACWDCSSGIPCRLYYAYSCFY